MPADVIRSEKVSGTSRAGRSELALLLQFVRRGDTLLVTRIDRLARSIRDLQDIFRELKYLAVALKATEQPIDTSTAAGKAFLDMFGVFDRLRLLGRSAADNWPKAFATVLAPRLVAVLAGRSAQEFESRVPLRRPDGRFEERVFETSWSPTRNDSGQVAGPLEVLVEVTAQRQAEAARQKSEYQLSRVLDGVGEGFGVLAATTPL